MPDRIPDDFLPNEVLAFIDQLVYAPDEYKRTLVMMLAVGHTRDSFTTLPHLLATAETPASGKSTIACDIPMLLAFNPWKIGKLTTEPALRAKYLDRVRPTPIADDIGKIFGDNGTSGKGNLIYALLIDSYRKDGAVEVSRSGVNQKLHTFSTAYMNGLKNAVPGDLFTRAIHFQMKEAPSGLYLRDALDDSVVADAEILKEALHSWAAGRGEAMKQFMRGPVRFIHPLLEKRKLQIWGPLFAAAAAAGGMWPQWIYDAFVMIALDASEKPRLVPKQFALLDTAELIMTRELDTVFVSDLVQMLRDKPTGDYYRKAEDTHLTQDILPAAFGKAVPLVGTVLTGEHAGQYGRAKGWEAAPILRAAANLRDAVYPPMEHVADETESDLAFTPITPKIMERTAA
jgi:hypothetical protein